jgi:hypothetical protein
VKVRYLCPTVAPVPVSRSPTRLRYLGDTGSGTCGSRSCRWLSSATSRGRYWKAPRPMTSRLATGSIAHPPSIATALRERRHRVLADRRSRPDGCPHQTSPEVEARIVALRSAQPGCLVRHPLISPKPRRRRPSDERRWERSRPTELWQIERHGRGSPRGRHRTQGDHRDR